MKRAFKVLALLALCRPLFSAAQTVYPAAAQGGTWLNLPYSTRAASLAGLGGDGQGVDALSYNPAGLAATKDYQLSLNQDYWLQDASSQRLGVALPLGPGGLGLAFDNVNFGGVDLFAVNSLGQLSQGGTIYPEAWALQVGYGLGLGDLSLGAALKGLSQNFDGLQQSGFGVDVGGSLHVGAFGLDLSVVQAAGTLGGTTLPLNADLEGTYEVWNRDAARVDIMAGLTWLPGDASTTGALGVEARPNDLLVLRAGYRAADAQSTGGWAVGLGLRPLSWLGVDYAYNGVGGLQATNQLTLNLCWDGRQAGAQASPGPSLEAPAALPTAAPTPLPAPIAAPSFAPSIKVSYLMGTLAGNGILGFSGDGGPALQAELNGPLGVAVDRGGNIFIGDQYNRRIREVDTSGRIRTVAGAGAAATDAEGGQTASLGFPGGVAVDAAGTLFIADSGMHRVLKLDASGALRVVAGNGNKGHAGDGGPATEAELSGPMGLAFDRQGDLYIADSENHSVRKVDLNGVISAVAGIGRPGFSGDGGAANDAALDAPAGLAFDGAGRLFIADCGNQRIREVDGSGRISTVAGTGRAAYSGDGGPAALAELDAPAGVAVDGAGQIFVVDGKNQRIRKIGVDGGISTLAGTGQSGDSGDGGPATAATLSYPTGIAVDGNGRVIVADYGNQVIRVLR